MMLYLVLVTGFAMAFHAFRRGKASALDEVVDEPSERAERRIAGVLEAGARREHLPELLQRVAVPVPPSNGFEW